METHPALKNRKEGFSKMLRFGVILALCYSALTVASSARWNGLHNDPWFRAQVVPGTHTPCCDIADGVPAEEDIREGHYWVRFKIEGQTIPWMPVPDKAIITDVVNKRGTPLVWYSTWAGQDESQVININCFIAGAKA